MHQNNNRIKKQGTFSGCSVLPFIALAAIAAHLVFAGTARGQSDPIPAVARVPAKLVPLDPAEVFGPETLFEKINGQAELYLSAGFVRLTSQWFAEAQNPDSMFEVYIYDMGDGLNAFSVFSAQRREDAQKVDLTQFAYRTENSLHLAHGPYYVEMFLAAPSETLLPEMTALARNFVEDTPADPASMDVYGLFPRENMDRESISLIARDAFGFKGLDRVFTAVYTVGGDTATAFVSRRNTTREATDLLSAFHAYLLAFGGKDTTPDGVIENAKMVEIMGAFDIMFSVNGYLAGVHEAPEKRQAEALAETLYRTLKGLPASGNR